MLCVRAQAHALIHGIATADATVEPHVHPPFTRWKVAIWYRCKARPLLFILNNIIALWYVCAAIYKLF